MKTFTIDEICEIDFYSGLKLTVNEYFSGGNKKEFPALQTVMLLIPKEIEELSHDCLQYCLEHAKTLGKEELENFIWKLPAGYIRMCVREIYSERFPKEK